MVKQKKTEKITPENIEGLWSEIYTLKEYFESLKFRDTVIGRVVLGASVLWIALSLYSLPLWLKIFPPFVFVVILYWLAQNGYFATIASLFSMVLENNFNPWLKNTENLQKADIECIDEQRILLTNYAAECPRLPLLYFIHENRIKKIGSEYYRFYADSPRFRKKLAVNPLLYFLAHFLPCHHYADRKYRVMRRVGGVIVRDTEKQQT